MASNLCLSSQAICQICVNFCSLLEEFNETFDTDVDNMVDLYDCSMEILSECNFLVMMCKYILHEC